MGLPFIREAVTQLFSKPSTEAYPAQPREAPPNYRGRLIFHPENCIDCGMCERVCAPGAITKTVEETPEGKRITRTFSYVSCTFCRNCADFCPRHTIEVTTDYHMVARGDEPLCSTGTFLKKPPVKPAARPPVKPAAPEEAAKPEKPEASAAEKPAETPGGDKA